MAGMNREAAPKIDKATREADETLRKENAVSLAIELLKRSATADGMPTIVFRQGEYVPFCAVRRSGGSGSAKQFENVASPEEVVMRATPVDLRLLYERRLLPALIGQVKEASGRATKEAAESDRPALIGRILTAKARQELRYGPHSRKSNGGILTCDHGWRLYGLEAPPSDPASQAKGGQSKIASFFGAGAAAAAAGGGGASRGGSGGTGNATSEVGNGARSAGGGAANEESSAADTGRSPVAPRLEPATPGSAANDAAATLEEEITRWEAEVEKLTAARLSISVASGHKDGQPLLLHNHASALANAMRILDAAKRKRSRVNDNTP